VFLNFGRRTLDVGPRQENFRTTAYEIVGGLEGDIPGTDGWTYDLSIQHGRTDLAESHGNDVSLTRLQNVLYSSSASINPGAVDGGICGPNLSSLCRTRPRTSR
jgi:hypothetical protein